MLMALTRIQIPVAGLRISALTLASYVLDWTLYIIILIISLIYGLRVSPRFHEFSLNDSSLMSTFYPEDQTYFPMRSLVISATIMPTLTVTVLSLIANRHIWKRRLWDWHIGVLALMGSISTQSLICNLLKNTAGLPRPDLLARCQPWNLNPPANPISLSNVSICSNPNILMVEAGFKSFPSGHASTIFAGAVFTTLFLAGRFKIYNNHGVSVKLLLVIKPIVIALVISATRISDNRHFLRDIVAGAIIGCCTSIFFYHAYFPPIYYVENGGRAYPPRRFAVNEYFNGVGGFWKIGDEHDGAINIRNRIPGEKVETKLPFNVNLNNSPLSYKGVTNPVIIPTLPRRNTKRSIKNNPINALRYKKPPSTKILNRERLRVHEHIDENIPIQK